MTFYKIFLGLTLTIALAAAPVWAAKHSKAKPAKAQETYAATESEDLAAASTPTLKLKLNTKSEIGAFDAVPSDQAESLSRRLQIVDTLIRRHGRAYDYRTMTIRDLQGVLAQLDGPVTQAPAKATPAALPIPSEEDEVSDRDDSASHSEM